jgi:hypothetical protein
VIYKSKRGTVVYDHLRLDSCHNFTYHQEGDSKCPLFWFYSNKHRGLRKKSEQMSKGEIIIADTTPTKKSCNKKWASLIKKIYEVDTAYLSSMFPSNENNLDYREITNHPEDFKTS